MTITPKLCRSARAMLGHHQSDIQDVTGISKTQLSNFEAENSGLSAGNLAKLQTYFEGYGLEFIEGGVREKPHDVFQHLHGRDGFRIFMRDVYETVKVTGGEICVSNVNEDNFLFWLGEEEAQKYKNAMAEVLINKKFMFKCLVKEGDDYFAAGKYAEYRWIPEEEFGPVSFYAYGGKLALIDMDKVSVSVYILKNLNIHDTFLKNFNPIWNRAKIPTLQGRL